LAICGLADELPPVWLVGPFLVDGVAVSLVAQLAVDGRADVSVLLRSCVSSLLFSRRIGWDAERAGVTDGCAGRGVFWIIEVCEAWAGRLAALG